MEKVSEECREECDIIDTCLDPANYFSAECMGGGGGDDGGGGGTGGGGSGGSGSDPVSSIDINTSDITTPCFHTVLSNLTAHYIHSDIIDVLYNVFGVSDKVNIRFHEATHLPDWIDGTTDATKSGDYLNIDIYLNTNVLQNSSQEYIAATILHEVIHGYFNYLDSTNPVLGQQLFPIFYSSLSNENGQHDVMAFQYVNKIQGTILDAYPDLPIPVAEALAWGGLQEL